VTTVREHVRTRTVAQSAMFAGRTSSPSHALQLETAFVSVSSVLCGSVTYGIGHVLKRSRVESRQLHCRTVSFSYNRNNGNAGEPGRKLVSGCKHRGGASARKKVFEIVYAKSCNLVNFGGKLIRNAVHNAI